MYNVKRELASYLYVNVSQAPIEYHCQGFLILAPVVGYKYGGTGGVVDCFFKAIRFFKKKQTVTAPSPPSTIKYASGMVLLLAV